MPAKKKKAPEVPVQTRLPPGAHRQLKAIARERGTSLYDVARDLIIAQIGAEQADPYVELIEPRLDDMERRLAEVEQVFDRISRLRKGKTD